MDEKSIEKSTRRFLFQWLGRGCVLSLSSVSFNACFSKTEPAGNKPFGKFKGKNNFLFRPGGSTHRIYNFFDERTVDKQNLKE